MRPVVLRLFRRLLIGSFLLPVAFGHGAHAQNFCGDNLGAQARGTIGSMVEEGGALSIIPRGNFEKTCSEISALRYNGVRALLSDCRVGKPFVIVGGLRPKGGTYILEGDVIRCDAVTASNPANEPAVTSPKIAARIERLNRAFSNVSLTTYSNLQGLLPQGTWNKVLIRGQAITIDANARLGLKYETCESGSFVQTQKKSNPIVSTRSSCAAAGDWRSHEREYVLASVKPTIAVRKKDAPVGPNWFEIEFNSDETAQSGSIPCAGPQACESMAEDLRGLVTFVHALSGTLGRVNKLYRGVLFEKQASVQGEPQIVIAKTEVVRANLTRLHTIQQVCVRRPTQNCDRDKLWRERVALADPSKLSLEVTLDETRVVSDDKTVGVAIVKCSSAGCWNVRVGGDGGNIRTGRPQEEIHCMIGEGCKALKRELEQLIALVLDKDTASNGSPDSFAIPSLGSRLPIWAKMESDGTIMVQHFPPNSIQTLPPKRSFPRSHARYDYVLRELGPFTPGDDFRQRPPISLD